MDQPSPEKPSNGEAWLLTRLVAGAAAVGVSALLILLPILLFSLTVLGLILWLLWTINAWFCVATVLFVTLFCAGISSGPQRRR